MTSRKRSLDAEETSCLRSTKKLKADTSFFNVPTSFGVPINCPIPFDYPHLAPSAGTVAVTIPAEPITSLVLDNFHRGTHQQPHLRNLPISGWDFDGDELNVRGYRRCDSPDGSESDTPNSSVSSDSETPELVYDTNWDPTAFQGSQENQFHSSSESLNDFHPEPDRAQYNLNQNYNRETILDSVYTLDPNMGYDQIIDLIRDETKVTRWRVISEYENLNHNIVATVQSMRSYMIDIELIMTQTGASEERVMETLDLCNRDIVNAIMRLLD